MRHSIRSLALALCALSLFAGVAAAQPLGTFRWQVQPYCNVLTVTVVQQGGQYQIDGTDDQCGAAQKASVVGLAYPNPDGSIGFGLATVMAPNGSPLHTNATIDTQTLSGTWRDSAGHSGAFVFTPGAGNGGSARPAPAPAGAVSFGTIVTGTSSGDGLQVANSGSGDGIRGTTSSGVTNVSGVVGVNDSAAGQVVGVTGRATASPIGTGVVGLGAVTGAFFQASGGPSGGSIPTAVVGDAPGTSGRGAYLQGRASGAVAVATGANGVGVHAIGLGPSSYSIVAEGHTTQSLVHGGFVKALATVTFTSGLTVEQCFNSYAVNPSVQPCGFAVAVAGLSSFTITFPFQVDNRFVLVTPRGTSAGDAAFVALSGTTATIQAPGNATGVTIAVF